MFEQVTWEHVETATDTSDGSKQQDRTLKETLYRELCQYKILFSDFEMTRLTILVWLRYICGF